ncbi:tail tubular protein A [Vibrio phage JSF28]|uniref:Tail tubular protein A n=3 Tax=Chatterjeevirus ICP3 TaxID=2733612 RepID=A0A2D0Z312_9CAUD|nr:tail fiber protein / tubular protein A [Vibrio phage JSF25]ASV42863.1 tail tubular protein A [Vibrio phage JSF28]ASV43191.1 tail tubular protein A [Vibrio phage JSF18]
MSISIYESNWQYQAELDAINDILASIGESPVNTLESDANADVVNARRILHKINRQEQSKGWTFNIEDGATLVPDVYSQLIPYMPNYLSVTTTGGTPYVNRGGYVYDRINKTDRFTSPITVNLITLRTFDEMPEQFKSYIVTKAAKEFNIRFFGAPEIDTVLGNELIDLERAVNEYELDYGAFNIFNNDPYVSGAISR